MKTFTFFADYFETAQVFLRIFTRKCCESWRIHEAGNRKRVFSNKGKAKVFRTQFTENPVTKNGYHNLLFVAGRGVGHSVIFCVVILTDYYS